LTLNIPERNNYSDFFTIIFESLTFKVFAESIINTL